MIKKYEKPSLIIKKQITRYEKEAVDYVAENQDITKAEAKDILTNDAKFMEIMAIKDKELRMKMMDKTLPEILTALELKVERGSMEQAQKAMTAWSIGKDKAMGADKYSKAINIAGEKVQVNLGFKFNPYKKRLG
jgi:hypothetical protein